MGQFWEGQKVLVAGGRGFLGHYITLQLLAAGARVKVADNNEMRNERELSDRHLHYEYIDLTNLTDCIKAAKEWHDVIINLAGRTQGIVYSKAHQGEMLYRNTVVQFNMLEAARQVNAGRYMCVSSSCVYPDDAPIPTKESDAIGRPEADNWGYGLAKWQAELQAVAYHQEYGLDVSIARPFNPYGAAYIPREIEAAHVIPALIGKILRGDNPLIVWGDGTQQRNFLHGIDTAQYMLDVCQSVTDATAVNIGNETTYSITGLVNEIAEVCELDSLEIQYDTSKPEGRKVKAADSTLLKSITNYEPKISLRQGIKEIVDWQRKILAS